MLEKIKNKVISGDGISQDEAMFLLKVDLEALSKAADEIRKEVCGNSFDMCAVMNVKGGRCSEDCKFCSQSCCSDAEVPAFDVRDEIYAGKEAKKLSGKGISHYCQVSSGRRMNKNGIKQICRNIKEIVDTTDLLPCVSLGLIDKEDLIELKKAGVRRVHNNLETSRRHFEKVCSSHTYDEKTALLKLVHEVGLELCSGGLFGIGETWEDRIDMAFTLREYEPESVPVNMLKPVKGTPMEDFVPLSENDVRRIIAVYRFILPKSYVRLAAGRDFLEDTGLNCFRGGCNAAITGNMVTVKGISIEEDLKKIVAFGFEPAL